MLASGGFSAAQLKYFAAVFMVIDHLGYFFGSTGYFPVWFRWIGRLSAPIFIFLLIESYSYTKNKEKLILRIYIANVLMGVIKTLLSSLITGGNGPRIDPNIFATYFLSLVLIRGAELIRSNENVTRKKGFFLLVSVLLVSIAGSFLPEAFLQSDPGQILLSFFPMIQHAEGSSFVLIIAFIFYLFREQPFLRNALYLSFNALLFLLALPYGVESLFSENYLWMAAFSVFFFYFYNKKRGHAPKWFFYIFYPTHIFLFYLIYLFL